MSAAPTRTVQVDERPPLRPDWSSQVALGHTCQTLWQSADALSQSSQQM
jgi:hypothetical protein